MVKKGLNYRKANKDRTSSTGRTKIGESPQKYRTVPGVRLGLTVKRLDRQVRMKIWLTLTSLEKGKKANKQTKTKQ